jgi:uncharacterized cupin superfamily protein
MSSSSDSFIVFGPDVPEEEGHYPPPFDEERVGHFRDLGRALGTKNLGLGLDRLGPGERSSFTHAHSHEEEIIYVLDGECNVRLVEPGKEPREVPLRAGHVVAFVAGTRIAHCFVNRSKKDCITLTIGERKRNLDRAFYAEDVEYNEWFKKNRPERFWPEGDP